MNPIAKVLHDRQVRSRFRLFFATLVIALAVGFIANGCAPSRACAQGNCGLVPPMPNGCLDPQLVCMCDPSGWYCSWVWICSGLSPLEGTL